MAGRSPAGVHRLPGTGPAEPASRGRNQGQLLLAEAEADRVIYALCAPDRHPTIWRRLDEVRSAFPDTDRRTIRPLAASVVASLYPDGGSAFHQHYQGPGLSPSFALTTRGAYRRSTQPVTPDTQCLAELTIR